MTAASGAVDALVADVLDHYRVRAGRAREGVRPARSRRRCRPCRGWLCADRGPLHRRRDARAMRWRRCATLNGRGAMATVDVLGEFIRVPDEAEATATEYERALDAIAAGQLDANVSVKLSALGLEIDRDAARPHARPRAALGRAARRLRAHRHGAQRPHRPDPGRLSRPARRRARRRGHRHPVVHAPGRGRRRRAAPTSRPTCAWSRASTSSRRTSPTSACRRSTPTTCALLEQLVDQGSYVAIATHDRALVDGALDLIDRHGLGRDRYEFQMLLGVAERRRAGG